MMIGSYPSVYAIGHAAINDIFIDPVLVQEKIDGSQFSFGKFDELECRSKNKQLILDAPEKMFMMAIETIRGLESQLHPGWIYRCEFLAKPKHNTLAYDRIPRGYLILFDVEVGNQEFLKPDEAIYEAERIGLEIVPSFYQGKIEDFTFFQSLLDKVSILGGTKIEGIVIKNYSLFTKEKKVAMGKYVSEAFKEIHNGDWRDRNPKRKDILEMLIEKYRTPARWQKAIQHLKERGELENSPRDIGGLIKEVPNDIRKEEEEEIKTILFDYFWKDIRRGVTHGLPEWYKEELAKQAFGSEELNVTQK